MHLEIIILKKGWQASPDFPKGPRHKKVKNGDATWEDSVTYRDDKYLLG